MKEEKMFAIKNQSNWNEKRELRVVIKKELDWDNDVKMKEEFNSEFEIASENIKVESDKFNTVTIEQGTKWQNIDEINNLKVEAETHDSVINPYNGLFYLNQTGTISISREGSDDSSQMKLINSEFCDNIQVKTEGEKGMKEENMFAIKTQPCWKSKEELEFVIKKEPDWDNDINVKEEFDSEFEVASKNIKVEHEEFNTITVEQDTQWKSIDESNHKKAEAETREDNINSLNSLSFPNQKGAISILKKRNDDDYSKIKLSKSEFCENIEDKTEDKKDSHQMVRRKKDEVPSRQGENKVQKHSASARERARTKELSEAFSKLRTSLHWVPADTKLSKLDILRLAACYISHLQQTLTGDIPQSSPIRPIALMSILKI